MAAKFFGLPNHISREVVECDPASFVPSVPPHAAKNKEAFGVWLKKQDTEHLVYNCTEALNPLTRPSTSKANPPARLHGLIADYDVLTALTDAECEAAVAGLPDDLRPNWSHRTFSGGLRLIWLLENPVPVDNKAVTGHFLRIAGKQLLKCAKLAPGFDEAAWVDLCKFYDVGVDWKAHKETPLAAGIVEQMLFDAVTKAGFSEVSGGDIEIPLDDVFAEVEKQFPGRWKGEFTEGARGVVFFDPSATNPTAAVVAKSGLVCFSQAKTFYNWSEILGSAFTRRYEQDRMGKVVENVWFDGTAYWYKDSRGTWNANKKETLELRLRACGLSIEAKKQPLSEVAQALHYVHEFKRVDGVMPVVFDKREIFVVGARKMLNTSRVAVLEPAPESADADWGTGFPWLAKLIDGMFQTEPDRSYFLAWWKQFYESALTGTHKRRHVLFVMGPVESAKTFLSNVVVAKSVGGHCPGAKYILGQTDFNKSLMETGLITIDDATVASSEEAARRFGERVKTIAVNSTFEYRAMYRDGQSVDWYGGLIVTGNDDLQSLKLIPQLDGSIDDKIMVVHVSKPDVEFSTDYAANEARVLAELPTLLRWLVNWEIPNELLGGRLGIKGYINEVLRISATSAAGTADLLEVVDSYRHSCGLWDDKPENKFWDVKAVDLIRTIAQDESYRSLLNKETARSVGRKLALLSALPKPRVEVRAGKRCKHTIIWRIHAPQKEE